MKKTSLGEMRMGWNDILVKYPTKPPEGYSSAREIAQRLGMSKSHVTAKLREARDLGKIDSVMVKVGKVIVSYYKD